MSNRPRSTGLSDVSAVAPPARAAITSATASACWVAMPPCLTGNVVASPATNTSGQPGTRPCSSAGMKPLESLGRPGRPGPRSSGRVTIRPASSSRPLGLSTSRWPSTAAWEPPMNSMPASSRSCCHGVAGCRAEDAQRRRLGGDERHVHVVDSHPANLGGGHQGELVERQRPRRAAGHDEGDVLEVAVLGVGEHPAQRLVRARLAERDRAGVGTGGAGADRDDEVVVGDLLAAGAADDAAVGDDLLAAVDDEAGAEVIGDALQRAVLGVSERERLGDGERAVREVRRGGHERDADPIAGQVVEGDQRLEPGDASSQDHDLAEWGRWRNRSCHSTVGRAGVAAIRGIRASARGRTTER